MVQQGSPTFSLSKEDWKKICKGAVIALLGAFLTYGSDVILNLDLGNYAALVTAIWSVLVNLGWKWIANNQTKK
jgi:hypothetical protein